MTVTAAPEKTATDEDLARAARHARMAASQRRHVWLVFGAAGTIAAAATAATWLPLLAN